MGDRQMKDAREIRKGEKQVVLEREKRKEGERKWRESEEIHVQH